MIVCATFTLTSMGKRGMLKSCLAYLVAVLYRKKSLYVHYTVCTWWYCEQHTVCNSYSLPWGVVILHIGVGQLSVQRSIPWSEGPDYRLLSEHLVPMVIHHIGGQLQVLTMEVLM